MATYNQLVYVHSSSYRRMFVNGTQIYNSAETGNLAAGNSSYPYITLMGRNVGTGSNAAGSLSIVRVYSSVLSNAEVLHNYNSQKGRFGLN